MILGLQIIAVIFALIMIYFAYLHYRRGEINGLEMFFWLLAWTGAVFIALFPEIFRVFSATIAISRAFDLAMIGGFVLVIPIVYSAYIRTKRLEKKLEELIRKDALKGLNEAPKKNKSS
ncbi:MAG: DUF2304 domain-containing protein [Candidatus Daviesbacteria bacterium]|nr:DUF2304 domain-containing protein [Candidatus Daviesbacteria bacterium]